MLRTTDASHVGWALLAGVLALAASTFAAGGRWGLGADGAILLSVAQNIADGVAIAMSTVGPGAGAASDPPQLTPDVTKPPLFPIIVALLLKFGVEPKTAGWVVTQASFAAAAVIFAGLALRSLPLGAAVAVSILLVLQTSGLIWSVYVKEDWLHVAFTWASLLMYAKLRHRAAEAPPWHWVALGALCAAAVLTRYLGIAIAATIFLILAFDGLRVGRVFRPLYYYVLGLVAAGLPLFIRFAVFWMSGERPAFYVGSETTYYLMVASILQSFQRDFLGSLFIWLLDGSAIDYVAIAIAIAAIAALLAWALRQGDLRAVSLYVAIYLIVLLLQLGQAGFEDYEARYSIPVEGLLLLMAAALLARTLPRLTGLRSHALLAAGVVVVVGYCVGQVNRFVEFRQFPNGVGLSREYCAAPQTIRWLRANVPAGSRVMATQGFYQVTAETNAYYWLPVPPATLYAVDTGYHTRRWSERDVVVVSRDSRARWLVLLKCETGDPMAADPGYGSFISRLFAGEETASALLRARFDDGLVYEIVDTDLR